jgi:CubicO group peptidase (beta-lactamase class C family)
VDWTRRLAALAAETEVPGAVLGIWADGEQTIAPYGLLSARTGVETTADSVFQIGSVSKPWTATMVMQLVAEGRLGLDSTVAELLPGVRIGRDDVAAEVTVRQLLTHTSGIDGDIFTDTGRGDECYQRYVELLADTDRSYPPGVTYSYCNSGFVLLGRIVEVLDGQPWDASLQARLAEPLGLTATCTLPEQALLHRAAVGHGADGRVVENWALARSMNPAGGVVQSAGDLLAFARSHLRDDSLAVMRDEQLRLPVGASNPALGLAWRLYDADGRRLAGHDGTTVGQTAFLRLDPDTGFALCLLTNSVHGQRLFDRIAPEVLRQHLGIGLPPAPAPAEGVVPDDPGRHAGRYRRSGRQYDVEVRDGELWLHWTALGDLAAALPESSASFELRPADATGNRYVMRGEGDWVAVTFDRFADGTPYVFSGGRAVPKVSVSTEG